MIVLGQGIDLVPVARVAKLIDEHGERFLRRTFTDTELGECLGHRRAVERLASRFAAKEAAMKALGTGLTGGITWLDISVHRQPSGQPQLFVTGRAEEIAAQRGITQWMVSLTDAAEYAIASVLAGKAAG